MRLGRVLNKRALKPEDLPDWWWPLDNPYFEFPYKRVRFHRGYLKLRTNFPRDPAIRDLSAKDFRRLLDWLCEECERRYPCGYRDEWNQLRGRLRPIVFRRDGYRCLECGRTDDLSVDHIAPLSLGGSNDLSNLQTLCRPCNSRKGARA